MSGTTGWARWSVALWTVYVALRLADAVVSLAALPLALSRARGARVVVRLLLVAGPALRLVELAAVVLTVGWLVSVRRSGAASPFRGRRPAAWGSAACWLLAGPALTLASLAVVRPGGPGGGLLTARLARLHLLNAVALLVLVVGLLLWVAVVRTVTRRVTDGTDGTGRSGAAPAVDSLTT